MSASIAGRELSPTPTEFKILSLFMKTREGFLPRRRFVRRLTANTMRRDENTIIVHISKLREKMNDDSKKSGIYTEYKGGSVTKIEKK